MTAGFAPITGLSAIADRYGLLLCDVFGTLHDARRTFPDALDALRRFRQAGGAVVLMSNSAEPGAQLARTLAARGIAEVCEAIVSAADVARVLLRQRRPCGVLHIGPERDRVLFDGLDDLPGGSQADLIVCTGYPDDEAELDAGLVAACRRAVPMLCTNPDTSLDLGGTVLRFAGLVAERYRALGGTVIETGKPAAAIYDHAIEAAFAATGRRFARGEVIGVGDTPALDAAGALARGFSAVLIAGSHAEVPASVGEGRRYRLPALLW